MKGIILAGGKGSRLYPLTVAVCKQLLPIFDKPLIYYPLSTLMMAGIREVLIITTPHDRYHFEALFRDGSHLGLQISYAIQEKPEGIAQAFVIGASFIGDDTVALILGDNIFYGHDLPSLLQLCTQLESGAIVFGYEVKDPHRYGVVEFDENLRVTTIEEKPALPRSRYAITGLYFYDQQVIEIARGLKPSRRGELEITDINLAYLKRGDLHLRLLGRGFAWLDTGTPESLQSAASYVQTIQDRQGVKMSCIEEIAYQMGFISVEEFRHLAQNISSSEYGKYLVNVLQTSRPNEIESACKKKLI